MRQEVKETKIISIASEQDTRIKLIAKELVQVTSRQNALVAELLDMMECGLLMESPLISKDLILLVVHEVFGIDVEKEDYKTNEVVYARYAARYLLKRHTSLSLKQIGKLTGKTDHSAVNRTLKLIGQFRETITGFSDKLDLCINKLNIKGISYDERKAHIG